MFYVAYYYHDVKIRSCDYFPAGNRFKRKLFYTCVHTRIFSLVKETALANFMRDLTRRQDKTKKRICQQYMVKIIISIPFNVVVVV